MEHDLESRLRVVRALRMHFYGEVDFIECSSIALARDLMARESIDAVIAGREAGSRSSAARTLRRTAGFVPVLPLNAPQRAGVTDHATGLASAAPELAQLGPELEQAIARVHTRPGAPAP